MWGLIFRDWYFVQSWEEWHRQTVRNRHTDITTNQLSENPHKSPRGLFRQLFASVSVTSACPFLTTTSLLSLFTPTLLKYGLKLQWNQLINSPYWTAFKPTGYHYWTVTREHFNSSLWPSSVSWSLDKISASDWLFEDSPEEFILRF